MAAITANVVRPLKDRMFEQIMVPVKSGVVIYEGAIVCIDATGYLDNLAAGNYAAAQQIGIVVDRDSVDPPGTTTSAGSTMNDRSTLPAGGKTVRMVAITGTFLMDFPGTITQAANGAKVWAPNNNDCQIVNTTAAALGSIVSVFSTTQAWVQLNFFKGAN